MARYGIGELKRMVEPDRVHRSTYSDPDIFELEMERIFNRVWTFVGHESQVKKPGDYWTVTIGRQPMILIRGEDGKVNVLYNRCPHRGNLLLGNRQGNAEKSIICSYHAWQFNFDGSPKAIPLAKGYDGTGFDPTGPACHIKPAPRVDSYRGFVFASLAASGPSLLDWLGPSKVAFDQMCDRAPDGEVEVVPTCFRVLQRSNWKFFLENQLDVAHAVVTHESTGRAALEVEEELRKAEGSAPLDYHFLSGFTLPLSAWDKMTTVNYPAGHSVLQGYMSLRPQDPISLDYEAVMKRRYGEERTNEILDANIHHVICYPGLSIQPPLQQLRAIRPLALDQTLVEIWHYRLKGAPEPIYRRALGYYNLVNSPSTMVNADDLWNFRKQHEGLSSDGGDWVSLHRHAGHDDEANGAVRTRVGTSEAPLRNYFSAWIDYMTAGN
ncbi:MAG: Rieske 2Fe-2S domain-containing protein [Rhodospirillaceae bacterium]|nr:Rieske 2Fe-2S domain-containing protein [Rhodospirillaceae bacterium]